MLKIVPNPEFQADVEITVPGQKKTGEIPLTFKYRNHKAYLAWIKTFEKGEKEERPAVEIFQEFVVGWGLAEDFNDENLEVFLDNYPTAYFEIFREYSGLLLESRIKN